MARFPTRTLLVLGAAASLAVTVAAIGESAPDCAGQPYLEAQIPGQPRLQLELAVTPEERARGLMYRQSLPEQQGMLFVFQQVDAGAFWNLNTLIPLSIAFVAPEGAIVDIQDMQPQTPGRPPDVYPPAAPYLYAIEANQGWYANNGVNVGDRLVFCLPPA